MPKASQGIPWCPVLKPLNQTKWAVVTTAGVHLKEQPPFDMFLPDGDPSFRIIDVTESLNGCVITHDYYDHSDADKDINVVFPIERFKEFEDEGRIGSLAARHYSFMGHIMESQRLKLMNKTAPEVAVLLKKDDVDAVLLTPG